MASTTSKTSMDSGPSSHQSTKSQDINVGPLPAYDLFLRALGESYLDFFTERIEEQYRDAMTRLLQRQRNVDSKFEERLPERDWTLRRAWRDLCDGLDRESEVRGAFINSLRTDVVNPLQELKETHERSRKRIKEDIKISLTQYIEYAENVLPRLRRTYLKRCQEVDEWRSAGEPKPQLTSPTISNPMSPKAGMSLPPTSTNTGPPITGAGNGGGPTLPRGRQSSIGIPNRRDRSPGSNTTSFSDLAHQGKRQLNNLRTLIETKGVGRESNAKAEAALRVVRAKREADEADKEYRKGVHAMETLRLRRAKTLEAGYTSLETLVSESAELMLSVVQRYGDNLTSVLFRSSVYHVLTLNSATNATNTQLSNTLVDIVHDINPAQDLQHLRQLTSFTLAQSIPKKILYYNYQVGECKDMLFGVSLVDYASSRGLKDGEVPKIVSLCIADVEARGLKNEGIYRVPGKHTTVMELSLQAERDEVNFRFDHSREEVSSVAALLKFYLRELPEPVFKVTMAERAQYTEGRERYLANNLAMVRSKIRRLPSIHQATLRAMLEHLAKITANQKHNKMDAKNLAVVFGPVLLGEDTPMAGLDLLTMPKDTLMEDLINSVRMIYDHQGPEEQRASSPPLPSPPEDTYMAGALNSRANTSLYGSSHTVIKTLPPQSTSPPNATSTTSELAPRLPPRPPRQARRATISTGSAPEGNAQNATTPSSSRPSEDGRANNSSRTQAGTNGSSKTPKLELKTSSANASAASSPVREGDNRPATASSYSAPSSKNPSNLALIPPRAAGSSAGDSATSLATTLGKGEAMVKRPSYSDSLLREPAVLMSQTYDNEVPDAVEEVDYPGSPDTTALSFRTAVNTPEGEEPPFPMAAF
ncbi:hypothetical protein M408DRAFT_128687 [Serendipita vermifera MAFF 305830]|uniref:Rho-GAP domain-containing protein n=1 Tax=Serendipita vermifera MAFF 305830 TaxID=933852 RepID=A0A0C3BCK3_SERVB|nr:hypothetical protein M408DRAFT_128687 [Serendipita vermifera MAFF 305830]